MVENWDSLLNRAGIQSHAADQEVSPGRELLYPCLGLQRRGSRIQSHEPQKFGDDLQQEKRLFFRLGRHGRLLFAQRLFNLLAHFRL